MSKLVAVFGDKNEHSDGDLQCDNNSGKMFVNGKLIALIGCSALPDALGHVMPLVRPQTGSSKLFVGGIAVHRHDDLRECGAKTIVTNQAKLYAS